MSRARELSRLANENVFSVDASNNVGINSTTPVEKLNVVGVVSATSFFGDGAGLTGVASTENIITGTAATFTGGIDAAQSDVSVRNLTGVAATFTGVLTYEDVTNIDSIGIVTARSGIHVTDGNVGLGTNTPATKLNIKTDASDDGILLEKTDGTDIARLFFDGTSTDARLDMFSGGSANIQLKANGDSHFSGGNLGVGTNSPRGKLEVSDGTSNTAGEAINEAYIVGATTGSSEGILTIQSNDAMASDKGGSIAFGGRAITSNTAGANWAFINGYKENGTTANYGGYLSFATRPNSGSISERMRITSGGTALFKAGTAEKFQSGTTLSAASGAVALSSGNVARFTSNESGNQTVNFTGVHATLSSGENVSFTVIITPNSSGAINAVQIDGVAQSTLKWSGGSAPSAGSSGEDVYTFTIFKTGTGTTDYTILGAATNYA